MTEELHKDAKDCREARFEKQRINRCCEGR